MQRYFIPSSQWTDTHVTIEGDDAHHVIRVMRFREGDHIICNHPDGRAAVCQIQELENDYVQATVEEWKDSDSELPVHVTIAQGLPKGDKMDLVLQKGTELGAHSFIPFQSERSIVKWDHKKLDKKLSRYAKIVKEASEQSHRNKIPVIQTLMGLDTLLKESENYDVKIFPYEEAAKGENHSSFGQVVNSLQTGSRILVCVGPEGGFSEHEASVLLNHGFQSVRLGPRILRTETAALYVLASISYHLEELEC